MRYRRPNRVIMAGLVSAAAAVAVAGLPWPTPAGADPGSCDDPSCIPGINRIADLGSYCDNVIYNVFATTPGGRVLFCDSARGLAPRYFRAMPVAGIREYNTPCTQSYQQMAQAPDGLFLLCGYHENPDGTADSRWIRGDNWDN
jgi:hypothetical protein